MWRAVTRTSVGALLAMSVGCVSGPCADLANWILAPDGTAAKPGQTTTTAFAGIEDQNPVFVPLGPNSYGKVFENVLQVLGDYGFEIMEANRYDGRIETIPRISPGLGLFLKPGSPMFYDRLLSTLQTYRHRVSVIIQPADNGGYFIEVIARKELEDLSRPLRSTAGAAVFRPEN